MYLLEDLRDLNSLSRLGCVFSVICVCWSDVEGDREVIFLSRPLQGWYRGVIGGQKSNIRDNC